MNTKTLRWVEAVVDHAIEALRYLREDPVEGGIWLDIVTNWANPVGSKSVKRQDIRRVLPELLVRRGYRQIEGARNSRVWMKATKPTPPGPDDRLTAQDAKERTQDATDGDLGIKDETPSGKRVLN